MKTSSRAVVSMLPLTCTGWIAVDFRGNVPYECTVEHPELPRGFPTVWRRETGVRKGYVAQKVQVSVKAIYEKRELAGTVNKKTPNSEKEKGGAE